MSIIPMFSAAGGGNEIRNSGWWYPRGWERFVSEVAMPYLDRYGRIWIHNPFGHIHKRMMSFLQRREALAGVRDVHPPLRKLVERFTRSWSKVTEAGYDVTMYVGAPRQLKTDPMDWESWRDTALWEISDILNIRPKCNIGFDNTYGRPKEFGVFGGPEGHTTRLIQLLQQRGHKISLEPWILASAEHLFDCSVVLQESYYQSRLQRPHFGGFGNWADKEKIRGEICRLVIENNVMRKHHGTMQKAIENIAADGHTALIPAPKLPDYPLHRK